MSKKSVSVIIPNFNGRWLLEKYLPPLYEALRSCLYISDYELIIIDDASNDTSVDFLTTHYTGIILLQNSENSGFSKTINKGIFVAKMDLVLLLNTDIFLPEDFFDWLIPHFFSHPALFGISPVIKNIHGNKFLEMKKLPFKKRNSLHYLDVISTQVGHSFYLCGGCALIDRLKLLELKGMDEMYSPFYFEDTDLSVRAWLRGWECLYTPEVEVLHCHSITINSFFSETYVKLVFARNKLLFNYLYLNGLNRFFFFLRCYVKFILGKILPSKSRKRFIAAFKMYQKVEERKKTRRELVLINGNSLNEILLKYFPQSNI